MPPCGVEVESRPPAECTITFGASQAFVGSAIPRRALPYESRTVEAGLCAERVAVRWQSALPTCRERVGSLRGARWTRMVGGVHPTAASRDLGETSGSSRGRVPPDSSAPRGEKAVSHRREASAYASATALHTTQARTHEGVGGCQM